MATTIILVRHGQTEWNRVERFRGRAEVPLNKTGLAQAKNAAVRISARWKPAAVYASPLGRATETAKAIAHACNLKLQPCDGLVDIDYGEWQGLTPEEARLRWPDLVAAWYEHPETVQIPGGESLAQVRQRVTANLKDICWLYANKEIVLVGHIVVNRLILLEILGLGNERFWHLHQDPGAINVIEEKDRDFSLVSMNDTCHLD
ncbi:MAG: histidine phosphatase family protein [Anaerolineaceae bacterium]|jgi:probable phosphoglycerate mutase